MRFDDDNAEVFFIDLNDNGAITKITHCTTSWWRKLLFKLGINVYYKIKTYEYSRAYPYDSRKFPLTPDECIEPKSESND